MPGHDDIPQRRKQQRRKGKERDFKENGQRAGKADAENAQDQGRIKARIPVFGFAGRVRQQQRQEERPDIPGQPVAARIENDAQGHEPVAEACGHAAAYGSQPGQPPDTVNEAVVAGHVERQSQQTDDHSRTCSGKAFEKAPHIDEEHEAGQAPEHGPQIAPRQIGKLRLQTEHINIVGNDLEQHHEYGRQNAGQPDTLTQKMRRLAALAAAHEMGGHGRQRQQTADAQQGERGPDGTGHGHGGHVRGGVLAGHGCVHKRHARL